MLRVSEIQPFQVCVEQRKWTSRKQAAIGRVDNQLSDTTDRTLLVLDSGYSYKYQTCRADSRYLYQ